MRHVCVAADSEVRLIRRCELNPESERADPDKGRVARKGKTRRVRGRINNAPADIISGLADEQHQVRLRKSDPRQKAQGQAEDRGEQREKNTAGKPSHARTLGRTKP